MNKRILIAGVGGVLGRELADVFHKRGLPPAGLALFEREFIGLEDKLSKRIAADVTRPETIRGICEGIDCVVSVIGITRLRGKVTHMDVDYQGNMNLLAEAKRAGVRKFVFISPAGTELGARQGVPLMEAKFRFEEDLKKSGLDWLIIRSGGFMADFAEMAKLAQKGRMYVIGSGKVVSTPIAVSDLAELMAADTLHISNVYSSIGGPRDMTWNEICDACFKVWGKPTRITSVPVWLCRLALLCLRPFSTPYHALGKLLLFFSMHSVPTQKRGHTDLRAYLNNFYRVKP